MQIKLPHWYLVLLTACHTLSDYICTRHVAACSDGTRACSDTKSRSARRECHDGGQRPALCSIPENGSSGKSSLIPAYGLKKEKDQCVLYLNMFYPSQGVPVMAIRNKMVLEGLDPNLLEWVFYIKKKKTCLHSCGLSVQLFKNLTDNISFTADDSQPDAPVPDGAATSAEDQDVAATSSDSESSFSDWYLPSTSIVAKLPVKAVHIHRFSVGLIEK